MKKGPAATRRRARETKSGESYIIEVNDTTYSTPQERPALDLWAHLFGDMRGHLVTFTGKQSTKQDAKPNQLDDTAQRPWSYPEETNEAAAYLIAESEAGRDAYFGVHLFREPGNRRGENASQILALWVDGDGAQVPEAWPQPTAVIDSSPGRQHFYWRLTQPIEPERAAQLNKRLAYGMGGDRGKWGLGTVLRAPGTRNYKRPRPTLVIGGLHE
jgi:hypothetical protein